MVDWVPDRQDVIWINCIPQVGHEMRNRHPFVVLSPRIFNDKTSLVLGLPMTTAEYNADNPFAVVVGKARKSGGEKLSYVLCHQPKSFDWRARGATPHPVNKINNPQFAEVCTVLNQILMLECE